MRVVLSLFLALTLGVKYAGAATPIIPSPPQIAASAYFLIDADSKRVLVDKNSSQRLAPASLTKIMTSYIAASELATGSIDEDHEVAVSVRAWKTGGSRMYIREGTKVTVLDLLKGVIIQSGNDASVALAEHIAGSEEAFADVMNQQALRLGMKNTNFVNSTGWPDEEHYTTAEDMAILTGAVIKDYPEHYKLYAEKYFTYNNIRQPNRNSLLWRDNTVDGVKTGHTEAAGYCMVISAKQQNMRLISVVMGASSETSRAVASQKLLTYGFRYFETHDLYKDGEIIDRVVVWSGAADDLDIGPKDAITLTIPRGTRKDLSASMDVNRVIEAPIKFGDVLGKLTISLSGDVIHEAPIVALRDVAEAGFVGGLLDGIYLFFVQMVGGDTLHDS